jgi:septal ring factor EnvC (AmiA/AmiB activator)
MFGRSRPVVFEDGYSRRRSRARIPRWLALLLLGIAAGVGATLYVQERHLPPRLSAAESSQLRSAYEQADTERQRLKAELGEATTKLDAALAERKQMADDLSASRQTIGQLRTDVAFVADALPPDPRGGAVQVRAARIIRSGTTLAYDVALTQEARAGALPAIMQLLVTGESARGLESTVSLEPVALAPSSHQVVRGSAPLPEGFVARQCAIRVLDRPGGQLLGTRVMLVR